MKITIIPVQDETELYRQYPGQTNPQSVFVQLDPESRILSTGYNPEIGNSVPSEVWHGTIYRYPFEKWMVPTMDGANEFMEELISLAETVCLGFKRVWNGRNHVGTLSEEGQSANEEISELVRTWSGDSLRVEDASDWFSSTDLEVTSETTDDELEQLAEELERESIDNGVHILNGLPDYLWRLREQCEL